MDRPTAFHCTYSPGIPELLSRLSCSLVVSTYQAGKVIFISPHADGLIQLPRTFTKPMGLAVDGRRLAVATQHEVVVLADDPRLAATHPTRAGQYDALFVPRAVYFVNEVDLHDMAWSGEELWAVNTLFACLCTIDRDYSFVPRWWPPFISAAAPEDRCHLNGMALVEGRPAYATALGTADTPLGWRENRYGGGVLIDCRAREIVLSGLPMPHSPRVYDGRVYALLSLLGALVVVDPEAGTYDEVARVPGFVRGLARHGDYAFVGMSKIRPGRVFPDLPLDREKLLPGIAVIHLPSGAVEGLIQYHTDCEEIYDVQVLPGLRRPGIIGLADGMHLNALSTPEAVFWGKPLDERP
ncbi:TIGR03032 family protein [bacterium]|nr:TIGR03032 family protein [Chloroflexi bacterium CFX6]RIL12133.1 MAG: TIGR03032 family protein [bacterium]